MISLIGQPKQYYFKAALSTYDKSAVLPEANEYARILAKRLVLTYGSIKDASAAVKVATGTLSNVANGGSCSVYTYKKIKSRAKKDNLLNT